MMIDIAVRRAVRTFGFDVERKRTTLIDLLRRYRIQTVLDVGANIGQFAERIRAWGFDGRIVSFEPLEAAYELLAARAHPDRAWETMNVGIGASDGHADLVVSSASVFSSIRQPEAMLRSAFSGAEPVRTERIEVRKLDSLIPTLLGPDERAFLKIDTQGYEREVLQGGGESLGQLVGMQLELSLTPMYEGEAILSEMLPRLETAGFVPVLFEPVVFHPDTGRLLQLDCVLIRADLVEHASTAEWRI